MTNIRDADTGTRAYYFQEIGEAIVRMLDAEVQPQPALSIIVKVTVQDDHVLVERDPSAECPTCGAHLECEWCSS